MQRRGGSLIRAMSPGTTWKHRGSPRSGLRLKNRRGIFMSPCRSLCPSPHHLLHTSPPRQLPIPMLNSPAPILPRISHKLEHERCVDMRGRARGETLAMRSATREYVHCHGLPLDHAAMVSMLSKGESTNEVIHQHGASINSPDLPTAHASDLPTPNNGSYVETSPHPHIWRHSMH